MRFSEWLDKRGHNSRLTATGLNAPGQAQAGRRFKPLVRPYFPTNSSKKKSRLF